MSNRKHGWHFAKENFKLSYGDNRLIEPGVTFTVDCIPIICEQGLHDSIKALDALGYAPGPVVSRTVLSGEVIEGGDKRVGTKRTHLWVYDATEELHAFARWCALEVIDLWDTPKVVREYLETGDENKREEAYHAADVANTSAVRAAVRAAAWASLKDAKWNAVDNAVYAASNASDAKVAALYAASNASDAKVAALYAAKDTAWYGIFDKQNKKLEQLLKDGWKKRNE